MENQVQSGEEILKGFFNNIDSIENVDKDMAVIMVKLFEQGKFTEVNLKNELQNLREQNGDNN